MAQFRPVVFKVTTPVDPYNPLNLPANTVRVRTSDGNAPTKESWTTYETATLVTGTNDTYDVYMSGTNMESMFNGSANVIEVLGANSTNITNMKYMFAGCTALTSIPLFDTSNVTNMDSMFMMCSSLSTVPLFDTSSVTTMESMLNDCPSLTSVPLFNTSNVTNMYGMLSGCTALTSVPLFDTSNVDNMSDMFFYCTSVQSGALALYQQASSQANPPSSHSNTFYECGSNTTTGAAELVQIPSSWGGTGA